ncbi:MAG TPA: hypothetical protein VNK49_09015 [Anaerolineales bacterium]|nr:hypothetical protein [Anaerolineales bacterium]
MFILYHSETVKQSLCGFGKPLWGAQGYVRNKARQSAARGDDYITPVKQG